MKKFITTAVMAVALAGASTAAAENLNISWEPNDNYYGMRGFIEYQDTGNTYPNFYVQYPDFNSTTPEAAADGEQVISRASLVLNFDYPDGQKVEKTMTCGTPFPGAEGHGYCHLGVLETPGLYNFTIDLTLTYVDTTKEPLVEHFAGSFKIPSQDTAVPTLDYSLTPTIDGTDFTYTINLGDVNPDDVESVLIALLKGGEAFNENATWHSTELSGTIHANFDGKNTTVWLKTLVTLKDGTTYQVKPWDTAMGLTKSEEAPTLDYSISVGEFTRTGATSGTLPYTITVNGDLSLVDHWIVWASRAGDENMNVTDVPADQLEGVLNLTVLPANATTAIWPKVQAVWKAGGRGDAKQTNCNVSTISNDTPVYTLTASNTEATGSTTGTVDYEFNVAQNADLIASYVVYVVRAGEGGDIEVGRLETTEAAGKIVLSDLPADAVTDIWVKGYAIDVNGDKCQEVQFPGEAQGWTGLNISTIGTGVETVAAASEEVIYFNLQGVKVARPEQGKIYIAVRGGKASKVLVK